MRAPPARTDAELELGVADSGPGLDPEQPSRVFERGYTTKPTDRPLGRGIGLALVRRRRTGTAARWTVANEAGAVFTVTLRRAADRRAPGGRRATVVELNAPPVAPVG